MSTITGVIRKIYPVNHVSEKFSKRDFVITTEGTYPQNIIVQCSGKNIGAIDGFAEGQIVDVHINIRGREWVSPQGEVKFFNTLDCWKIEDANNPRGNDAPFSYSKEETKVEAKPEPRKEPEQLKTFTDIADDLPF